MAMTTSSSIRVKARRFILVSCHSGLLVTLTTVTGILFVIMGMMYRT